VLAPQLLAPAAATDCELVIISYHSSHTDPT
jgi:hypothetical protein